MATQCCTLAVMSLAAMAVVQSVAFASPVRPVPLEELVDQSEVVATGYVTSVTPRARTIVPLPGGLQLPGRLFAAEISVSQILKGSEEITILRCEFSVPDEAVGFRPLSRSRDVLVFLTTTADHYRFTNPYFGFLPVVPLPAIRGASPLDRVTTVLAAVLDSPSAAIQEKGEIVDTLSRSSAPSARAVLHRVLGRADGTLRLWAAAGLIRHGDIAALKVGVEVLMNPPNTVEPDMVQRLNGAVAVGMKSVGAIPLLAELLGAANVETRRAAATALRWTGASNAIGPLISALSDVDTDVQYSAIMGLAEITGKRSAAPSIDRFRQDPASFVGYWKNWARSR